MEAEKESHTGLRFYRRFLDQEIHEISFRIFHVRYPPVNESISHLGKRKTVFKSALVGNMLVPGRVSPTMDGEIVFFLAGHYLSKNEASSQQVVEVRVRFLGSNREGSPKP